MQRIVNSKCSSITISLIIVLCPRAKMYECCNELCANLYLFNVDSTCLRSLEHLRDKATETMVDTNIEIHQANAIRYHSFAKYNPGIILH